MIIADKNIQPIDKNRLVAHMEQCCKPKSNWMIGVEYEKFAYNKQFLTPLNYTGNPGIVDIFHGLKKLGWTHSYEDGVITKLYKGQSNISLEPGGQLELASTPHKNLHLLQAELLSYTEDLTTIANEIGISYLTLGFHPTWKLDEIPKMPNPNNRYEIICNYMREIGIHGVDMMFRTCSAQASIDFGNEADMVKKYRVALSLQPILTALYSNSPFVNGLPNKSLSYRSYTWANANPKRCGLLPIVFEDGFSFERYVDYALDLPLYLVYRDGKYIDAKGQSFRDFLEGRLSVLPKELPTLLDWENHIGTLWPEVRLKNVLEIRGADSGPLSQVYSLSAICVGLLYDNVALDAAWDVVKHWNTETREKLRHQVIHIGLGSLISKNITVKNILKEILDIAKTGLRNRAILNDHNQDESIFLDSTYETLLSGTTPAERLLQQYYEEWNRKINLSELNPF